MAVGGRGEVQADRLVGRLGSLAFEQPFQVKRVLQEPRLGMREKGGYSLDTLTE